MSVHALAQEAHRRSAELAQRKTSVRIATDDSSRKSRTAPGRLSGVLAALAQGGIWLTVDQRAAVDRLLRTHPELSTGVFTPEAAVERLTSHGIRFTDEQLARVAPEGTISGIRRRESLFEARSDDARPSRTTRTHPVVVVAPAPPASARWPAWWRKLTAGLRRWFKAAKAPRPARVPSRGPDCYADDDRALGRPA